MLHNMGCKKCYFPNEVGFKKDKWPDFVRVVVLSSCLHAALRGLGSDLDSCD